MEFLVTLFSFYFVFISPSLKVRLADGTASARSASRLESEQFLKGRPGAEGDTS